MNYERLYNQIINRAKLELRKKSKNNYFEGHHIIPKCLRGTNDTQNIVLLTSREHFIVHWILIRIYPNNIKLAHAFYRMCSMKNTNRFKHDKYIPSSRMYQEAKENWIPKLREQSKSRKLSINSRKKLSDTRKALFKEGKIQIWCEGKKLGPLSDKHKQKCSNSLKGKRSPNKGKIMSIEQKNKISKSTKGKPQYHNLGRVQSEEERNKKSLANLGRLYNKKKCEFCNNLIPINNIKRHSNICKNKLN